MPGMLAAAPHSMKGLTFKAKKKLKAKHMTQSQLVYSFESQSKSGQMVSEKVK